MKLKVSFDFISNIKLNSNKFQKILVISCIISYVSANGYAIPAALKSRWNLDIREVHLPQQPIEPQIIEVPALELPVKIIYNSKSSGVYVQQVHQQGRILNNFNTIISYF
jgi:hypothetical protein